VIAAGKTLE